MLLKCLLGFGHDEWCHFSRRCSRHVVNVRPAFQFGREPDPVLPHLFGFSQSFSQSQSKRRLATVIGRLPLGVFTQSVCRTFSFPAHKLAKTIPSTGHHRLAPSSRTITPSRSAIPVPDVTCDEDFCWFSPRNLQGSSFVVDAKLLRPSRSQDLRGVSSQYR